jgi:predicted PurR-regulated permease PerM
MTQDDKRKRLALVGITTALVIGVLFLARGALFPFVLSGVIAYLLYPVVRTLEQSMPWRDRWPIASRVGSVLLIYVLSIAALAGALAIIVPPAFRQSTEFVDALPELFDSARATVEGWSDEYTARVPEGVREQIEKSLESSGSILIDASRSVLTRTVGAVSNVLTTVIGLAVVPFMVFYLLKDREASVDGFYSLLPPDARRHARNVLGIANQVLGAYVRGQLILAFVVGIVVFVGLFALGIRFSVLLGLVAGVFELVPVIGPLLGAIPGVLVTLATSPGDLVWVVLLYVGVQLVENALLVPRIQGKAVDIHPAIIMVALVLGSEVAGLWGVVVAVPLGAVARDVFKYFNQEWSAGAAPSEASTEVETVPAPTTELGDPPSES